MIPALRFLLSGGVAGLSAKEMRAYLEFVADQRLAMLGMPRHYNGKNPFPFMDLQDVQELANFFERRVSAYQVGVTGEVGFDSAFSSAPCVRLSFSTPSD